MIAPIQFLFVAAVLSGVISEFPLKSEDLEPERIYVTGGFSVYEAAEEFCESIGKKLATLTSNRELPSISKYLSNHGIAKVWVGARLSPLHPECNLPQRFNPSCWEWEGFADSKPITDSGAMWFEEALIKTQSSVSRAYYDVTMNALNIDDNTRKHAAICENYPY